VSTFSHAITFIGHNGHLLEQKTLDQLALSGEAVLIALLIGLPLGLGLGHLHRGSFAAINISNVGRALPSLAILAIGLKPFGVGSTDVVIALVVLAVPPLITNAYLAVDQVDRDVVGAARGIGMSPWQVFTRVELPLATGLLFAGIRTAVLFVISTATLAGFFGGGGLGDIIANQASYRIEGVIGAAVCVIVLALLIDAAFALLQRKMTPRGVRIEGRLPAGMPERAETLAPRAGAASAPAQGA